MTVTLTIPEDTRNGKLVLSFAQYCLDNPDQRFWQAVRNWSEHSFVYVSNHEWDIIELDDTFYFEGPRD